MRILLATYFLLISTLGVQAAVSQDELQDLVYASDFSGVEAAMAQAHLESLSGEISYDDLRNLGLVLFRTHPDTEDFLEEWLKLRPNSPYANAAKTWQLYNRAYEVSGRGLRGKFRWYAAEVGRDYYETAMTHAMIAFEAAPDYVPASDGVIRLQLETGRISILRFRFLVPEIMAKTPNFGTLLRYSDHSDLGSLSITQGLNERLCNSYHDQLPAWPTLTYDDCLVALRARSSELSEDWGYVADVLENSDHPLLAEARARHAIARRANQDVHTVMEYLETTDLTYPWLGTEFWMASQIVGLSGTLNPQPEFVKDFQDRVMDATLKQLEHDPYRLSLLRIAVGETKMHNYSQVPNTTEQFKYLSLRIALVQPYHPENWIRAASVPRMLEKIEDRKENLALRNAVVYSGYDLEVIGWYLKDELTRFRSLQHQIANGGGAESWPNKAEFEARYECRLPKAIRLFELIAQENEDMRNYYDRYRLDNNLAAIRTHYEEKGYCDAIWSAPFEELEMAPVTYDRRDLLTFSETTDHYNAPSQNGL